MLHVTNILNNLIDNAIKYSSAETEIIVSTSIHHKLFEIIVKDNGPGIQQEYYNKIFENFFRISNGNIHTVKGFGLGLYYVKTMMQAHRGKVVLSSGPGLGSEFKLYFPVLS